MTVKQFFDTFQLQGTVMLMYENTTLFNQREPVYSVVDDKYTLKIFLNKYGDLKIKYLRGSAKGLEICLDITTSYA